MEFYKFIKIKGKEAKTIGYWVPHLYHLSFDWRELKSVGFEFVKQRLAGWHIWWVENEEDYAKALKKLHELQKTHFFRIQVSNW